MRNLAVLVLLVACAPQAYVSDVRMAGDTLVVTKCNFDYRGDATNDCHDEVVGDVTAQTYPSDDSVRTAEAPDPRALAPEPSRPAPNDADIARALAKPGVQRLVSLCHAAYAADVSSVRLQLTVAPSGSITQVAIDRDVPARFGECAAHAVRTASLARYDGAPVTSQQVIAL